MIGAVSGQSPPIVEAVWELELPTEAMDSMRGFHELLPAQAQDELNLRHINTANIPRNRITSREIRGGVLWATALYEWSLYNGLKFMPVMDGVSLDEAVRAFRGKELSVADALGSRAELADGKVYFDHLGRLHGNVGHSRIEVPHYVAPQLGVGAIRGAIQLFAVVWALSGKLPVMVVEAQDHIDIVRDAILKRVLSGAPM